MMLINSKVVVGDRALDVGQGVCLWRRRKGNWLDLLKGRTNSWDLWEMVNRASWRVTAVELSDEKQLVCFSDNEEEEFKLVELSSRNGNLLLQRYCPLNTTIHSKDIVVTTAAKPAALPGEGTGYHMGTVAAHAWVRANKQFGGRIEQGKVTAFGIERVPLFFIPDPNGTRFCGTPGQPMIPVSPLKLPVCLGTPELLGVNPLTFADIDAALVESGVSEVWFGMPAVQPVVSYPDADHLFVASEQLDQLEHAIRIHCDTMFA